MNDGKQVNNFLNEVGGIRVTGELEKVLPDAFAHKFVLLVIGEKLDQSLNGMSALLIPHNVGDVFMQPLHYFESLCVATHTEQFLHHVICILVGNQLR